MPWNVNDVEKHKKGLSEKQKKKWVEIANSVLHKCMKEGKDETTCAVIAIRQANGSVGKTDNVLCSNDTKTDNKKVPVRKEMLEGIEHFVVPATILVEGVHNGTGGPVFYPKEELEKSFHLWNGVPIPIGHPEGSANDPGIINSRVVGRFFNAFFDDTAVKGEFWINETRLKEISPDIFSMVEKGEDIEISTSLYSGCDGIEGVWNAEQYEGTVFNYKPDHVAILGKVEGACNFKDGCGIRDNSRQTVFHISNTTSLSYAELEKKIREKLKEEYPVLNPTDVFMCYIADVWDNHFVYEHGYSSGYKFLSQDYKVRKDKIVFVGEPVEVEKKYSYIPINNKEVSMDKKKLIEKILANEEFKTDLGLKDETSESLFKMDDKLFSIVQNAFNRITGCGCKDEEKKSNEKAPDDDEEIDEELDEEEEIEDKVDNSKKKPKTAEEYIEEAPPEIKEVLNESLRLHNHKKNTLVKELIANKRNKFSKAALENKSMEELLNIAELADVPVNMEGKNFTRSTELKANERQSDGTGVPECPKINWKE